MRRVALSARSSKAIEKRVRRALNARVCSASYATHRLTLAIVRAVGFTMALNASFKLAQTVELITSIARGNTHASRLFPNTTAMVVGAFALVAPLCQQVNWFARSKINIIKKLLLQPKIFNL